ncbi:class I SAM-dependent methyltransferase [Deferribacter thermophilus]|uniref:class I SAM-dependent DNA methyltransferase n=1 Tax=Deferribacter thermophilus TaxID=53573 RepID=UPI003C201819
MSVEKFDKSAFTYDQNPMHVERGIAVANAIKKLVPIKKDWVIADFGCGTGLLGINFVNDVKKIVMIDASQNMLKVLKEKLDKLKIENVEILKFDITKDQNLPNLRFDLIVTLMTFHHINDIKSALNKLFSMIKKDGYLALADLDEEDGSFHKDKETVHNGINQTKLRDYAKEIGFEFVKSDIPYVIKRDIDGQLKEYPVFLHIYCK